MRRPLSLTARMSALFALSAAGVLLLAGVLFARAGNNRFLEHDLQELNGKIELVQTLLGSARTTDELAAVPARLREAVVGHPDMAILVTRADGARYSTGNPQVLERLAEDRAAEGEQAVTWRLGEHVFRIARARAVLGVAGHPPATVTVALDISEDQAFLREFDEFLWFGIFLVGIALGWLGWVVVRHGLSPLSDVSARMAAISAQALDQPLSASRVPPELQELVSSFNTMLARLDDSFRRLTEFSDDIAHELRTPINNLLLQTQVTLDGNASLDECRAALQANEQECQQLSRMIADMLFLAKADNRLVSPRREALELDAEVDAVFEFYEALAAEHGVRLERQGSAPLAADRLMLRRALSNLLANALRFTPAGMAIRVTIGAERDGGVRLEVANPGPEIPEAQRARVFERLYRVDPARQEGHGDNVGLGLAIARSIVELHGGTIGVHCAGGYTTFTLHLPPAAAEPAPGLGQPAAAAA